MRQKGFAPTFLVTNSNLRSLYGKAFANVGGNVAIYCHEAVSGVLMGYRGESYIDSGYVLCPYVPFTTTPGPVGVDQLGLLTRYGKKLMRAGARYYGRISVNLNPDYCDNLGSRLAAARYFGANA